MIFQSANEMVNNINIREKLAEIQAKGKADKERWEKERANVQSEFLKELDKGSTNAEAETSSPEKPGSDEEAVLVEGGGPASTGIAGSKGAKKRKGKK